MRALRQHLVEPRRGRLVVPRDAGVRHGAAQRGLEEVLDPRVHENAPPRTVARVRSGARAARAWACDRRSGAKFGRARCRRDSGEGEGLRQGVCRSDADLRHLGRRRETSRLGRRVTLAASTSRRAYAEALPVGATECWVERGRPCTGQEGRWARSSDGVSGERSSSIVL